MHVPFVDIGLHHSTLRHELDEAFHRVLASSSFVLGAEVEAFEKEFAAFSRAVHCVTVANGTDALELALRALSVGPGDEVIVPAHTFIASALAVLRCGAKVKLVDIDPKYHLLEPQLASEQVTDLTRAIIPVHLYGQAAPCESIIFRPEQCAIVEDAAQAQGAMRHGQPVGALGVMAATSFYPTKNLGALGDGGAVITNESSLARSIRSLRNYGSEEKYVHRCVGFNSRLDELQAAILRIKLRRLEENNSARQQAAQYYTDALSSVEQLELPQVSPGNTHVWHLYVLVVRASQHITRDCIARRLRAHDVETGIHYPLPLHFHQALAHLGYTKGAFPVAEDVTTRTLSLPLYPGITSAQQDFVIQRLMEALCA